MKAPRVKSPTKKATVKKKAGRADNEQCGYCGRQMRRATEPDKDGLVALVCSSADNHTTTTVVFSSSLASDA